MAGGKVAPKGGKKNRKYKRNQAYCERYRREDRENVNRKRKMRRHIRNNPNCKVSVSRYEQTYGLASSVGMTARGERLLERTL